MIKAQRLLLQAVFGILLAGSAQASAAANVCVLSFLPKNDRIAKAVAETFPSAPEAQFFSEAIPMDIVNCINQGFSEIIIIAHAVEMKNNNGIKVVRMGYVEHTPQGYALRLFYNQIFKVADQVLSARKNSQFESQLTKIRFMACAPQDISNAYPAFGSFVKNHSLTLDVAPKSILLSLINRNTVTSFNAGWLAKSISCKNAKSWKTNANRFCKADHWPGCDRDEAQWCIPTELP